MSVCTLKKKIETLEGLIGNSSLGSTIIRSFTFYLKDFLP